MAVLVDVTDPRQPLPAAFVARQLGVSKQLFYWWIRDGKLQPADHAADGRPLYRLMDAAPLERQMRRSPNSRRRAAAAAAC